MAQIKKISDGKYLIRVSKGTGKSRTYVNKTFRGTRKDAAAYAREQETLLDSGLAKEAGLNFATYKTLWLGAIESRLAPLTFDNYAGNLRRHTSSLNALRLADIRTHHIQRIYNGLSSATARSLHATLHACFEWAIKKQYLRENPCRNTDRPRSRRPSITVLQGDEISRFVAACRRSLHGVVFEFALETGMRPEEYLALRWSDIHDREVSVEQIVQYNRKGGGFYFAPPKTAKSRRRVPISEEMRRLVHRHRIEQHGHRLSMKGTWFDHDLVFPNDVGRPMTLSKLTHYFKPGHEKPKKGTLPNRPMRQPSVLELAVIESKGLTLYSLRHTCATMLLLAGVNPKVVADRLGHSSVVLTLDTYSHVLPHIQADATEMMNNIMRKAV